MIESREACFNAERLAVHGLAARTSIRGNARLSQRLRAWLAVRSVAPAQSSCGTDADGPRLRIGAGIAADRGAAHQPAAAVDFDANASFPWCRPRRELMSKGLNQKKNDKKQPLKTPKEKKLAKQEKAKAK